ncbi:MAG: hypothetical protein WDM79_03145 [Terricaulis sp.]
MQDRVGAPLADALALIVRERLTGLKPPASAAAAVAIWRPEIEANAGAALDRLTGALPIKTCSHASRTMCCAI